MTFPASLAARIAAFAFAASTLLSACTVVVEEPRPGPPPGPRPGFCTREYAPVCARRGGDRRTFNNSCLAEQAGYRIVSAGECRGGGDDQQFCTREYAPVCARRGPRLQTFPNECEAEGAGYRVVSDGPC